MGCGYSLWPFPSNGTPVELEYPNSFGHLSTELCSKNVSISANDTASGEGVVFADSFLVQTKCYWEITIETKGKIQLGVSGDIKASFDSTLDNRKSTWYLDLSTYAQGTVIGVSFDLSRFRPHVQYYADGKEVNYQAKSHPNVDVSPIIYIGDGASVRCNFGNFPFKYQPAGFEGLMCAMDLL